MNDAMRGLEAAAILAERKRRAERKTGDTTDDSVFASVLKEKQDEKRRKEEAVRQKEEADMAEMERMLLAAGKLLEEIGRPVESFFINPGGQVIVSHRKYETVRTRCSGIDNPQARRIAVCNVIRDVAGY